MQTTTEIKDNMSEKKHSKNYVFHFHTNSKAANDINRIIALQECCFEYICKMLDINFQGPIEYFLCNSREEVGILEGSNIAGNGVANPIEKKIYAVYNEEIQCVGSHEDVHVISHQLNEEGSYALGEGLAMFFDKNWWGIHNTAWTFFYINNDQYQKIVDLVDNDYFDWIDCSVSYPIMGCFTEYLILTYGIDRFKELYHSKYDDLLNSFEFCYKKSLAEMETEFLIYVKMFPNAKPIDDIIRLSIKEYKDYIDK